MEDGKESEVCVEKTQENPEVSAAVVDEKTSPENSEYDSVDSYSDEEQPIVKARSKTSGVDSHSETEGSVILEREEGDGQESVPSKKVDDDEDKKNPQYIPKRGTFYEHDDRTADDIEAQEAAEADKDAKKKVWQDKKEKWKHDRFNDQEQAPKSRAELISIYGYDIRNEDGPPRARRRRRYGRGPNKYTRNWEDEEAYNKATPVRQKKPQKTPVRTRRSKNSEEEFPPLGEGDNKQRSRSSESYREEGYKEERNNIKIGERQENKEKPKDQSKPHQEQSEIPEQSEPYGSNKQNQGPRVGSGRVLKPNKEIKDSDYRGFTKKTRQQRGVRNDQQKVLPPRNFKKENEFIQSQNFTNKNNTPQSKVADVEKDMSHLSIQDGSFKGNKQGSNSNQNRQGSVPPRLQQSEQKGSKRYSSMRQRSLPESGTPPANFSFYPNDYNSTAPPPASQQPILPTPIPPPTLVAQQVPVTAAAPPLLQGPFPPGAPFAPQPPPQAYLQPGPPPPFIAPPAQPQIVSYVPSGQPPYIQGYQGQFNSVTQPTDLYQPQGGITYYSTDQQVVQRSAPQKRPKTAIPIVAPNDFKEQKEQEPPKNQKEVTGTGGNEMVGVQE